jgi:hypothetical protein
LVAEAEENNLDHKVFNERWGRWYSCSLCEQEYHGVVGCALGWACWKTYLGRPETDWPRQLAMTVLGNSLYGAKQYEDALSVLEARLSTMTRLGAPLENRLSVQSNIANTYRRLGRDEETIGVLRDVYSGYSRHLGEENGHALMAATNYAITLVEMQHFKEAKPLMRKTIPVVRRVFGENHEVTLRMRWTYAKALYASPGATLDDMREAVATLAETERISRRVLGGTHPNVRLMVEFLRTARAKLRARQEAASRDVSGIRKAVEAMTMGDA